MNGNDRNAEMRAVQIASSPKTKSNGACLHKFDKGICNMATSDVEHPDLQLTGRTFSREQLDEEHAKLDVGDLKLYDGLDYAGRLALKGGHTNYGYSGTVRASIWDGRGWRRLRLISFLGDSVCFAAQNEKDRAYMKVRRLVAELAGKTVRYDGKRYVSAVPAIDIS